MPFDNPIDCSTAIISDFVFHLGHMNIQLPLNIPKIYVGIYFCSCFKDLNNTTKDSKTSKWCHLFLTTVTHLVPTHIVPGHLVPMIDPQLIGPSGQTVPNQFSPHGQMVPKNLVPLDKWSTTNLCP